jgi:hypothetical protein
MSQHVLRPCLECGRPCHGSRCAEHAIDYGYETPHWQAVRRARLALDGYRCTFRHPGCTVRATTVHLAPECGGRHALATLDNTRSACLHCHGVEDGGRATGGAASPSKTGSAAPHPAMPAGPCTASEKAASREKSGLGFPPP